MKYRFLYIIIPFFVIATFSSCSEEEPLIPEVIVPDDSVDFFTESMVFSANGGTKTLSFKSNVSWTIELSEPQKTEVWCHISQSSGNAGKYNLDVTVDKNEGYEDRNVVLVLTAGDIKRNVIVNQKQKDALTLTTNRFEVGSDGGQIEVEVNSNVEYEIEVPVLYKEWISQLAESRGMSTKKHTFIVGESKEYDKREGEIISVSDNMRETVKVYQAGTAILVLSQNEFVVSSEGGVVSLDISSNFEYKLEIPEVDWLRQLADSRAVSSHTLRFVIDANTTYANREVVLLFKDANGKKEESVTIKQRQNDAILLSKNTVELSQEEGTFSVNVNSNVDYEVKIDAACSSWISRATETSTRGMTTSSVSFVVSKNEEYEKREGEVYFTNGNVTDTLSVYQSGGAIILLTQDTYNVGSESTTINVKLKSNIEYDVAILDEWISEYSTRAISSSEKIFQIETNDTDEQRVGKINFVTKDGSRSATVTIIQEKQIKVTSLNISFYGTLWAYVGDNYKFFVTSTPSNAIADYEWDSSNTRVLTVNGNDAEANVNIVGYGEADVIVKDKYTGVTAKYSVHSTVSGFSWNETGEKFLNHYPMVTMVVGETYKLSYITDQGTVPNLFANLNDFVFYNSSYVIPEPSAISIDADGNVLAIEPGINGIKPTGYIMRANDGNDRLYINVVSKYTESEYNNDFSTANMLKDGTEMEFRLSSTNDVDVFKFNALSPYMQINIEYLGSLNYETYSKRLRYEVYDSSYTLTGSGTLSFKGEGEVYEPMPKYVGNGDVAYVRFYFEGSYTQNFPDGNFKISVNPYEF